MPRKQLIFLRGARQLITLRGPRPRRGLQLSDLSLIRDGSVLIDGQRIVEVGSTRRIENLSRAKEARVIDVSGKVVLPGFVDAHMRLAFAGPPLRRFEERIAGAPVAWNEQGERTPSSIRAIPARELRARARRWTYLAAAAGATTVGLHSRQNLEMEAEIKGLRVAQALAGDPVNVAAVFGVGVPPGLDRPRAEERALEVLDKLGSRKSLCYAVEVELGRAAFDVAAARRILVSARQRGFALKLLDHGDETDSCVRLALELGASSVERLGKISEAAIDLLADSQTVAMLLPGVAYHQESPYPPARRLVDRGAAVALASGFGPTLSPGFSLPMAISLACREMRLMPEEAIAAATLNAAVAIGQGDRIGSIEPDKQADMTVFDVADYREIPYFFGVNLCALTIQAGRVIYRAGAPPPLEGSSDRSRAPLESRR
ncbi:MAG: amidohydrolase family protein [Acidobacteria bacterium]|nr:amidohydrolase family protein [Acidobacteriota bacterium]